MEESDLLRGRLQSITASARQEKHRIQEHIRQKKLELDQEKVKLQHLKKKALREQWLLQDSASHNATDSPQQQSLLSDQQLSRAAQLNIHRIEMQLEHLEREEAMISTNESFILNRLKAVERSPEDIIEDAKDSCAPETLQVTTVAPDVPGSPSPPANKHYDPNRARKTLFAINVRKNLLTGESTVRSTATLPPEEVNQHARLKVYDDGRKCVYALNSQESCVSELSPNEVEQLLRTATVHHHENHQNYHQNHSRREEHCFYNHQDESDRVEDQGGRYGDHLLRNNIMVKDLRCRENWQRDPGVGHHCGHQESHYRRQEVRNNQNNLSEGHHLGNHKGLGHHYGNQKDRHYSSYQVRGAQEDRPASHHGNGIIRSKIRVNGGVANGCTPPRSHEQEVVSTYQPLLSYTPANYIPPNDYISVDEAQLYCYSHDGNPPTALYSGSTHSDRVPSPLYRDDPPYTILKAMESTEPITAVFMGFQTAQDDSEQVQEFESCMKAELVTIEEEDKDRRDDDSMKEKKSHALPGGNSYPTGSSASGSMGPVEGAEDRRSERPVGPGIKKIQKNHCCTVC